MSDMHPHDMDWLGVPVVTGYGDPEVAVDTCVFTPHCQAEHTSRGRGHCSTCGRAACKTCIRSFLPKNVSGDFVQGLGEPTWVCPMCAMEQHRDNPPGDTRDPDSLSLSEDPRDASLGESDDESSLRQPGVDTQGELRATIAALAKRVDALEREKPPLLLRIQQLEFESKNLKKQLGATLAPEFSPHTVGTWRDLEVPAIREKIRDRCRKAFREDALPVNIEDAKAYEYDVAQYLSTLTNTLDLITDGEPPKEGIIRMLHSNINQLTGITQLGLYGPKHRREYVARAEIIAPKDFSETAQRRLLKGVAEEAKKEGEHRGRDGDRRDRDYRNSRQQRSVPAHSRDRKQAAPPTTRDRDWDRKAPGGKPGKDRQ
eukprot:TRINITY_DN1082_c0_g1_i1.p1 TRINITY_DN1082_c0_g1~~TRINITY_DN1082_c0_g1_i1.p1  ORF type:complete len:372 (+),score=66.33 TRINITY_DN1082_c0_g1_i1:452-1567(+)